MVKQAVPAQDRLKQFKNCGFSVKGKKLWCDWCNVEVNFSRKCVIEKHTKSTLHQRGKCKYYRIDIVNI